MKFWFIIFFTLTTAVVADINSSDRLSDRIYEGILKLREHQYVDGYASTALGQLNIEIKERAEMGVEVTPFNEKVGALAYLADLLQRDVVNPSCSKGINMLAIRVGKAIEEDVTLTKARQWVQYVKDEYCFGVISNEDVANLTETYLMKNYPLQTTQEAVNSRTIHHHTDG